MSALIDAIGEVALWLQRAPDAQLDLDLAVAISESITARLAALDGPDRARVKHRLRERLELSGDAFTRSTLQTLVDDIDATAWPFEDPPETASITLKRILRAGRPILLVARAAHDGMFEFLDGESVADDDAAVVGLETIAEIDPTILEIADLDPGWVATRSRVGGPWSRTVRDGD